MHERPRTGQFDFAAQQLIGVTGGRGAGYRYAMPTTLPTELAVLTWGCILGFVHILAAAQVKTRQYGTKWNMGARDEELPPPQPIVGRLTRAQANFFETFPIFIAAVILAIDASALDQPRPRLGAWLWLGGRVAYLPLYAFGVPVSAQPRLGGQPGRHRPGADAGADAAVLGIRHSGESWNPASRQKKTGARAVRGRRFSPHSETVQATCAVSTSSGSRST